MSDSFDWMANESTVYGGRSALAVYQNPNGDIVIRQERDGVVQDEDPFVVVARDRVQDVIAAIRSVAAG